MTDSMDAARLLFDPTKPLTPGNAVVAIIVVEGERYLLQHRDSYPHIFFPDCWGFFGGGVEPGETELTALARELREELGLDAIADRLRYLTRFTFDFAFAGGTTLYRSYYTLDLTAPGLHDLALGEGQAVAAFSAAEAFSKLRLVPYDGFALWMHAARARLAFPS
jgi:8-oxo-dGTP pyrophosphatase MutT (NUDIX family)